MSLEGWQHAYQDTHRKWRKAEDRVAELETLLASAGERGDPIERANALIHKAIDQYEAGERDGVEANIEAAAKVIWEAFGERLGGPWSGKDSSMGAQHCWDTAVKAINAAAPPPSIVGRLMAAVEKALPLLFAQDIVAAVAVLQAALDAAKAAGVTLEE
jgi:hypothetical protein